MGNAGEPLDTAAIAEEAGVGKGPYLYSMLRQLVERGDLVQDDVGYTIPRGD